jgi:hypothetical protein
MTFRISKRERPSRMDPASPAGNDSAAESPRIIMTVRAAVSVPELSIP